MGHMQFLPVKAVPPFFFFPLNTQYERELVNNSLALWGIHSGHRMPGLCSPCQAPVCKEKVEQCQRKEWNVLLSPLWSILQACSHTVPQMFLGRGTCAICSSSHFISLIWRCLCFQHRCCSTAAFYLWVWVGRFVPLETIPPGFHFIEKIPLLVFSFSANSYTFLMYFSLVGELEGSTYNLLKALWLLFFFPTAADWW